jgi:hypothetical protein
MTRRPAPARFAAATPSAETQRLIAFDLRHVAEDVADALVIDDVNVTPARHIEVEQVHGGAAQPIRVGCLGEIVERHHDPGLLVEWRICRALRYRRCRRSGAATGRR